MIRSIDIKGSECYLVGCDIWRPYLRVTQKYNPYADLVICDIRHSPFKAHSTDLVLAFEVIEHLERKEGFELLEALKNLAPKVVISAPAGFYVQGKLFETIYMKTIRADGVKRIFEMLDTALTSMD